MREFNRKSWLIGFALGLCGKPLPIGGSKREPVAYLYNGVELPDINEVWTDKETYPYAFIRKDTTENEYSLFLAESAPTGADYGYVQMSGLRSDLSFSQLASGGTWGAAYSVGGTVGNAEEWPIFWTSHDIPAEDGSLLLAASEPVPVYE